MVSSDAAYDAFSGRSQFDLRIAVAIDAYSGNNSRWDYSLRVDNPSGTSATWSGDSAPYEVWIDHVLVASGTTPGGVFDFRDGAAYHNIKLGTTGWIEHNADGNRVFEIRGIVTGAHIFGSADAKKNVAANRIPKVPGKPPKAVVTSKTSSSVNYNFTNPADDGGTSLITFNHQIATDSAFTNLVAGWDDSNSPASRGSLEPGTTYYLRYRATNSIGAGPWADTTIFTTDAVVPSTPWLDIPTVDGNDVSLTWDAPFDGGSPILEYEYQRATNSTFSGATTVSTGTNRFADANDLAINNTWYFRIRARNAVGWSNWSSQKNVFLAGVPSQPGTPFVTNITGNSLTLSWNAPANNGSPITGYDYQIADDIFFSDPISTTSIGNTTSVPISSLTMGERYYFRVRAKNAQGTGPWSPGVGATMKDVPDAPNKPTASGIEPKSMRIDWNTPNNNGYAISGYTLQRSESPSMTSPTSYNLGVTTNHTPEDLLPGRTYYWRVRAVNSLGNGDWSSVSDGYKTKSGAYVGSGGSFPAAEIYVGKGGEFVLADDIMVGKGGVYVTAG